MRIKSMINPIRTQKSVKKCYSSVLKFKLSLFLILVTFYSAKAQTNETMAVGSYIINMGVASQTINNTLKPYGLIYDLTKNYQVPIKWVINTSKAKDGIDFSVDNNSYRAGCFIIPAEFRTAAVNARITHWQGQGVVGATTNSPVTVPVYATIRTAVRWTLDDQNGQIAEEYLKYAGIPTTAYDWVAPSALGGCNDIFVMPHAEPQASTHGNLVTWNNVHRGSIWVGCKAGSETENNVGKFLTTTGCVNSDNHNDLSGSVLYDHHTEPVMQFLGTTAHLSTTNGAEQIYYPLSTWLSTTKVGAYQEIPVFAANQRKALIAWGRGFGDSNRGWVCMTAGHKLNKATALSNVTAMRSFFNFSLLAAIERTVRPTLTGVPDIIVSGSTTPISFSLSPAGGSYSVSWSSSCGGTFSPNSTSSNVSYTPPSNASSCIITATITDACGRTFFDSKLVTIQCQLNVTSTPTHVSCNGGNNGAIALSISGSPGPYTWNWARTTPAATGSGSGTTINGLTSGNYQVTVTSPAGCVKKFSNQINQPNALTSTATLSDFPCGGPTSSVSLSVSGGTSPYSFQWSGPSSYTSTSQNINNLSVPGTYSVTVTDSRSCTSTTSAIVIRPIATLSAALTSKIDPFCVSSNTGSININVTGGTTPYTYLWSNGATTEDIASLSAGSYSVTVTDANLCKAYLTVVLVQATQLTLSATVVHPTCPPGSTPPLGSNGSINLTVVGGTTPYSYNWADINTPPEPEDRSGLAAGSYSVTVTDNNGCTGSLSVTITNTLPGPKTPGAINN